MDAILQQKHKGEAQFRVQIDQFLASIYLSIIQFIESPFIKKSQQFTPDVLQQLFSTQPKQGLLTNNKISLEKLTQAIYQSGCPINHKQFQKLFNNKKQLKPQQIYQLLKTYDMHEFNLQEEVAKYLFEDEKLSLKKLDKTMRELGYEKELNKKDKQIMIECFDYDRDGQISRSDIRQLIHKTQSIRLGQQFYNVDKNTKKETSQSQSKRNDN